MTVQIENRINAAGGRGPRLGGIDAVATDDSEDTLRQPANRVIVTMLVLSMAAVLFGLVTLVLGQWVAAGTHDPQLVDTADCHMIAMASGRSLDTSKCNEPAESSATIAGDSAHAQRTLPAQSILRSSRVVTAPGIWIHSVLQSVG